ncbi:MAG: hypothetical protein HRT97_06890 [Moritella sp.]|uniref:hypothetical protein n=1 Tax=Moritella sp. TaxID=78556 RepID=UPI0025D203B9|nr:hypothetical protein [Moritella sp.]NQZ92054.1 hypothetical protein [Moritella sp.]
MNNNRWEQTRRYSHIGISSNSNATYAIQYLNAYEILYESKHPIDTIALPMLYTMRHYLELALKSNIEYFHEFSGSRNMVGKTVHTLTSLSNAFQEHWKLSKRKFGVEVDDTTLIQDFGQLIKELETLDSYAVSFRYSHDREKNKNFQWSDTIDIYQLNELFKSAKTLLNHSVNVFEDYTGLMDGNVTKEQLLSLQVSTQ